MIGKRVSWLLIACALASSVGCASEMGSEDGAANEPPDLNALEARGEPLETAQDVSADDAASGAGGGVAVVTQALSSPLTVANGNWGTWDTTGGKMCPPGTYATQYAMKIESKQGSGDDTGMNGIALWCTTSSGTGGTTITSTVGQYGVWSNWAACGRITNGKLDGIVGAEINVEPSQGSGDDAAASVMSAYCNQGPGSNTSNRYTIRATPVAGQNWGTWGNLFSNSCAFPTVVCGIQTRVEAHQSGDFDDTELNGLRFQCCFP